MWGLPTVIAVFALGVLALRLAHRALTVQDAPSTGTTPFLSGWAPAEHALSRYHVRWYPATLLFLAFDVEMLFMYPWALVVREVGTSAVIEMFAFLGVLMVAVLWARREGALRWV
nr:NADH-quinone oxidoreductase subunit A [Nakamurella flavida]